MFKDTERELKRLEAELLEDDQIEDVYGDYDEDELEDLIWDQQGEPESGYDPETGNIYNGDSMDGDLDYYSDQVYEEPGRHKGSGPLIFGLILITAVLLAFIYWIIVYGGIWHE